MKPFSQMTDNEFSYLKQMAHMCLYKPVPAFSGNVIETKLDETYFQDVVIQRRISDDYYRWFHNKYLSNKEMMQKVRAQIKEEKEARENSVQPCLGWEKLLKTKLFNNSKI